jgi:hypothetical protein
MCRGLTGMPHEHEMPAPVTTTIFLDLATAKEMSESALRVLDSPDTASSCSEIVMRCVLSMVVVGGSDRSDVIGNSGCC